MHSFIAYDTVTCHPVPKFGITNGSFTESRKNNGLISLEFVFWYSKLKFKPLRAITIFVHICNSIQTLVTQNDEQLNSFFASNNSIEFNIVECITMKLYTSGTSYSLDLVSDLLMLNLHSFHHFVQTG